jgi:uncharacterized protein YraI
VSWRHGVNLRSGPGVDFAVIRVLPQGTVVNRTGASALEDGVAWIPAEGGWLCGPYLEPVE